MLIFKTQHMSVSNIGFTALSRGIKRVSRFAAIQVHTQTHTHIRIKYMTMGSKEDGAEPRGHQGLPGECMLARN